MAGGFGSFVIFAEMRTGSNLLEETLNQVEGVKSHGELFNHAHLGGPGKGLAFGMTKAERDAAPQGLLDRLKAEPGLNGFRFFHDHDPRVLPAVLADPLCAKIMLSRNPVESYVSLLIARQTGEWRTRAVPTGEAPQPNFDRDEFEAILAARGAFRREVNRALQISGQTAFHIDYDDLQSVEVINGLLAFLGAETRAARISQRLVPQNPASLADKVANVAEMEAAVSGVDWTDLARIPGFETWRGPGVGRAVAAADAPLMFLPIPSCGGAGIRDWLSGLGQGGLTEGFTQGSLRNWLRDRPRHRSFTVVRHPMLRAYATFRRVQTDAEFDGLRVGLEEAWDMPRLRPQPGEAVDAKQERAAFFGFLRFIRANLRGQTPVQQNLLWASQMSVLQGMAQFALPDLIAREEVLHADLSHLAQSLGLPPPPAAVTDGAAELRAGLSRIVDDKVAAMAQAAYSRDYQILGYEAALPPL
ncbi:MAG TPA: nodulation protein NodH [Albidovulum sp.]|uniref:nodulation protein NodH n=1 Tax=Albidovulum sp. TaxID=1872424 RepID=UPI002C2EF402|nr:nodulation protein NodH [Albidovulum sp.]